MYPETNELRDNADDRITYAGLSVYLYMSRRLKGAKGSVAHTLHSTLRLTLGVEISVPMRHGARRESGRVQDAPRHACTYACF
jgi:hypothetical protein